MAYERIQCPKCPSSFGQEARFVSHLSDVHGVDDPIVLYLEIHHEGVHPTCSCSPSCPDRLPWSGWKRGFVSRYARGHNARVDSVYLDSARQAEFAAKRSKGFSSGKYSPWNKGLTKETSAKVEATSHKIGESLRRGHETGSIVDWRVRDPVAASTAARKISETKRAKFSSGEIVPWNLGLTKETSRAVMKQSDSIKENYAVNPDASSKRFRPDHIVAVVESIGKFDLLDDPASYRNKYQKMRLRCRTCGQVQLKNMMMLSASPVCFSCASKESRGSDRTVRHRQVRLP